MQSQLLFVLSPLLMIIYAAQGEGAEQDVEQQKNQSDQNEVCISEYTMHVCSLVPKVPNPWEGMGTKTSGMRLIYVMKHRGHGCNWSMFAHLCSV